MNSIVSRRLITSATLLLFATATRTASAQVPYVSTQYAEMYTPVTNGTPVNFGFNTDDGASMVAIGFDFPYYGNDYAYINVGVNGAATFARPCNAGICSSFSETCDPVANVCARDYMSTSSRPLPSSSDPQAAIAVFWDDLILDPSNQPTAQVVTQLSGTAPNRIFTIEWQNIRHFPRPSSPGFSYISMQIRLQEGTGLVFLSYSTFTGGSNNSSWSGIMGIEDHTGMVGISPLTCVNNSNQCSFTDLSGLANQTIQLGPLTTAELIGEIRPSTGGNVGDPLNVEVDVRNVGTVSSSTGFSADVYFSPDTTITPGVDTLLGTLNFTAIDAGALQTQVLTTTVPAGALAGYYTIGAIIDSTGVVDEAVETNNTVSAPDAFLVGSEVSLAMDTVVVAAPNELSTLSFRILNEGSALSAVPWNLYLSTDQTLDAMDTLVATGTSAVPSQPETTVTTTTVLPTVPAAQYFLIGVVDPGNSITEADENNNESVSPAFLIGAELRVGVTAPSVSGPGEPIQLQLSLLNDGWELDDVEWSIYVSLDQTFDVMDNLVATGTSTMGRLRNLPLTVNATVPLGILPQDQYFIALIDPNNLISETDENNNVGVAPSSTEMVGPDISVDLIEGPLTLFRGESYVVDIELRNEGGATAENFYCGLYLSDNLLITVTDPLLDEIGPFTLAPGATTTIRHVVDASSTNGLTNGFFHLGIIADSRTTVLEERENNNIARMQTDTVEVRDAAPDFIIADVRTSPKGSAGESIRIQRTLDNLGNATGDMSYSIYLSQDRNLDLMGDVLLTTSQKTLAPGQQDTDIDTVRIPSNVQAGSYSILYVADPAAAVEELDEMNNISVSAASVEVEASSLQILSTVLPLATIGLSYDFVLAAVGGSATLQWSVSAGSLPVGMNLDASTGRISGAAAAEGRYPIEISVTDGALISSRTFNFIVSTPSIGLNLITRGVPPAWIGRSYEYPLTARGGVPPYTWIADGIIPRGLTLTDEGFLVGTPIVAGSNVVTFRVVDALGAFDEKPIAVRIIGSDDAVRFSTDILRDGVVGRVYDEDLRAVNGVSPYTFELAQGELPAGLELQNNKVTGSPTEAGTFSFSVRVVDNRGDFDLNYFVVEVVAEDALQFVTNGLPAGRLNEGYQNADGTPVALKAISPAGNDTIKYSLVDGALPPGLELSENGTFTGSPTEAGVFDFLLAATDGQNQTTVAGLGILVYETTEGSGGVSTVDESCSCQSTESRNSDFAPLFALLAGLLLLRLRQRKAISAVVLGALVSLSGNSFAQSIPYFNSQISEPYVSRTGGQALVFSSSDDGEATVTLPFPFKFYDAMYTSVKVSTNGLISFDPGRATDFTPDPIPSSSAPNNYIAAIWDDLTSPRGSVHIEGTAPQRVAIIQWEGGRQLGASSSSSLNFQFKLYEGLAGKFEIHYGTPVAISIGLAATAGYENATGSEGHDFLSCSPRCGSADYTAAANQVYRAIQDGGEDVLAAGLTAPASVFQAIDFNARALIVSQHQNPIGPFSYEVHLMSPGETTPNNPIYSSTTAITLAPYESRQIDVPANIPIQTLPGRYRLALVVDSANDINEPDESNNIFISTSDVVVAERRPDFTVPEISIVETNSTPGGIINVSVTLENAGNLAAETSWDLFLSPNAVVSVDDVSVYTSSVSLTPLSTDTTQVQVTLPTALTPGRYWIGAIADTANSVQELDEINNIGVVDAPIPVGVNFVDVTTSALPGGYVGIDYSTFLQATGGDGSYTWSKTAGDWPDGISLIPNTGELRGRPTLSGDYDLTLRVTSNGLTSDKMLTLSIQSLDGGLTIATRSLLPGIVGQDYPPVEPGAPTGAGQRIIAIGGTGAVMFTLEGLSPPGLSLDADGFLSGVPTQSGRFDLDVSVTDGTETATRTLTLTVVEPGRLTLVSEVLDAEVEETYQHPLQVLGDSNTATLSFALKAGALPSGLALTENGLIVGVPQEIGRTDFAVEVVEGVGASAARDTANYTISVRSSADFAITPSQLQAATLGEEYQQKLEARGGTPPLVWSVVPVSGALPRGLRYEVNADTGREFIQILGTPEEIPAGPSAEAPPVGCACGISTLLIEVRDAVGRTTSRSLSIQVSEPNSALPNTPTSEEGGCGCATLHSVDQRSDWIVYTTIFALFALIIRRRRRRIR